MVPICCVCCVANIRRGGLVGYDAGFTHLRSRVQFPALVTRRYVSCVCTALDDNTNQFHRLLFIITTYQRTLSRRVREIYISRGGRVSCRGGGYGHKTVKQSVTAAGGAAPKSTRCLFGLSFLSLISSTMAVLG